MQAHTITRNHAAEDVTAQWKKSHRRRTVLAGVDRISDGVLAAGGALVVNSVMPLGFALPRGQAGLSLGASMVCAGVAWMMHNRRHSAAERELQTARARQQETRAAVHAMRARQIANAA